MRGSKGRYSFVSLILVFLFGFLTLQLGEPLKVAAGPVKIVSPLGGSVVSGSVRIALSMRRRSSFAKVYVDGVYLASTPGTISWLSTSAVNGMHTVSAQAYDSANQLIGSSSRMIRVKNGATPAPTPTAGHVTITSPSSGATVSGTVSIAVSISSVSWVNFYVDGSWIASSPPYSVGWDSTGVSNGLHSISVNGYNSSNALVATALSTINVQNGSSVTPTPTVTSTPTRTRTPTVTPTSAPTTPAATPTPTGGVSISAPKSGATVSGTVSITAVTTAPVVWVNYYIDGNWMVSSPPFTVSWNSTGVANGQHTIAVNGYNSSNALVATNALNVSVQNGAGATPTPTKLPTATPTSTSTGYYSLLPKGSTLPTDSQCAAGVAGDKWDPRPANAVPNSIKPTASEMTTYKSNVAGGEGGAPGSFLQRADGQFTGGTDAILKWASCKWGFDENVTRATAVNETHWRQTELGDVGNGISLGILQVKSRDYPASCEAVASSQSTSDVTNPNCFSYLSTAFDADYKLAQQRACFEGQIDYMIGESPAGYPSYPNGTPDQMMWGCVGWWYSGHWYDSGAVTYISEVKGYLSAKTWAQPGF